MTSILGFRFNIWRKKRKNELLILCDVFIDSSGYWFWPDRHYYVHMHNNDVFKSDQGRYHIDQNVWEHVKTIQVDIEDRLLLSDVIEIFIVDAWMNHRRGMIAAGAAVMDKYLHKDIEGSVKERLPI